MKRRARLVALCAAGVATSVVAGVLVASWPALVAEYHAFRLERARTYEEAKPLLAAIEDDAARGTGGALLARLHGSTSYATFWFFTLVGDGEAKGLLASAFEERLRAKEDLLRIWSHYVRWRDGINLLEVLDSIPPGREPTPPSSGITSPACVYVPSISGWRFDSRLYDLGVLWFLGVPLPDSGEDTSQALADWLRGNDPYLRSTVYDESLGRCKREDESTPFPTMELFVKRKLPVPHEPLPGWQGEAPKVGPPPYHDVLIVPVSLRPTPRH